MKYMKNHFAGILSVILAVVSLSGSSMPVVSANSAERITKKETIVKLDEKLGVEPEGSLFHLFFQNLPFP